MKIVKNDMVLVISGNQKGKKGKVLKVFPETNRVLVEGVNLIKRHTKPSSKNQQGGIIEKEGPIHCSNVMVISNNVASRVGMKILEDGSRVRFAKKTDEMIVSNK